MSFCDDTCLYPGGLSVLLRCFMQRYRFRTVSNGMVGIFGIGMGFDT